MHRLTFAKAGLTAAAVFLFNGTVALAEDNERVNCIFYSKYDIDTPPELLGNGGKATNQDRVDAAAALKAKYDKDQEGKPDTSKTQTEVYQVDGEHDGEGSLVHSYKALFDNLTKNKKCCRRIDIIAHGRTDGSLELPYDMPVTREEEKEGGIPPYRNGLGGKDGEQMEVGRKWVKEFGSQVKTLLCPDPEPKPANASKVIPPISLYACYTADPDSGGPIAKQIAKATETNTMGYTDSCTFTHDNDDPKTVFEPTGKTATYDKKGKQLGSATTTTEPKKDEPSSSQKQSEAPKKESKATGKSSQKSTKGSMKSSQSSTQSSRAKPDDHAMSSGDARALGTAIGIGVGIGLGMSRGGDRGDMRDR